MLEDYPSEITALMIMNYVRVQADSNQLPSDFYINFNQKKNGLSAIASSINDFKTELLYKMDFNAFVQDGSPDYKLSVSIIGSKPLFGVLLMFIQSSVAQRNWEQVTIIAEESV